MKKGVKYIALLILIVAVLCTSVSAATYSNAYIRSARAYIYKWAPGDISVEYTVTGTAIMDTIGAHRVTVYRATGEGRDVVKDEFIATYWYENTPGMMTTDEFVYHNSIRLNVPTGGRYYAVVVFYATRNGGGDNMFYSTSITAA